MNNLVVGDKVRIKDINAYLISYQKKLKDRIGIIDKIQVFEMSRYTSVYYWVTWQKRGNRGKEFRERHRLDDLEIVP